MPSVPSHILLVLQRAKSKRHDYDAKPYERGVTEQKLLNPVRSKLRSSLVGMKPKRWGQATLAGPSQVTPVASDRNQPSDGELSFHSLWCCLTSRNEAVVLVLHTSLGRPIGNLETYDQAPPVPTMYQTLSVETRKRRKVLLIVDVTSTTPTGNREIRQGVMNSVH